VHTLSEVTFEKQYFIQKNNKVYAIYDPPHLPKNIRKSFKKHGFIWRGSNIQWKHVADFFGYDKDNKTRLALKLTDVHIELHPLTPM